MSRNGSVRSFSERSIDRDGNLVATLLAAAADYITIRDRKRNTYRAGNKCPLFPLNCISVPYEAVAQILCKRADCAVLISTNYASLSLSRQRLSDRTAVCNGAVIVIASTPPVRRLVRKSALTFEVTTQPAPDALPPG